jgi:hypothetical protein
LLASITGLTITSVNHPIHLHGHDFFVLAQVPSNTFDLATSPLNLNNPLRRDVASLPGGGYLVIAFKTDNPGSWLMHCHIAWHASEGFALQFVERESEIRSTMAEAETFLDTCSIWDDFYGSEDSLYSQDDSGI